MRLRVASDGRRRRAAAVGLLTLAAAAVASLGAMAFASSAMAKSGGNSANAKLCQKGGYLRLYSGGITTGSVTFSTEQACTSYAATGGTLTLLAGAAACSGSNVGFSVGGTDPFTDEPLIWHCGGSGDMPSSLVAACATDQLNLYGRTAPAPVSAEGDTWSFWCDAPHPFAGAAACYSNGNFSVGGTDPFTDAPLIWHCGGSGDMPSSLVTACATDQLNLYGSTAPAPVSAEGDTWSFWCDAPQP